MMILITIIIIIIIIIIIMYKWIGKIQCGFLLKMNI